jgi:hypothetical protein
MPFWKKKSKVAPFNPADVANIATSNPYIQRLIEDAQLRANVQQAAESGKKAFDRLTNAKTPARAVLDDRKLQHELKHALEAARDATLALTDAPKHRRRKGLGLGKKLLLVFVVAIVALVASEGLRSKVLDALFGAEEEFEYTPPPPAPTAAEGAAPTTPVSAA